MRREFKITPKKLNAIVDATVDETVDAKSSSVCVGVFTTYGVRRSSAAASTAAGRRPNCVIAARPDKRCPDRRNIMSHK